MRLTSTQRQQRTCKSLSTSNAVLRRSELDLDVSRVAKGGTNFRRHTKKMQNCVGQKMSGKPPIRFSQLLDYVEPDLPEADAPARPKGRPLLGER